MTEVIWVAGKYGIACHENNVEIVKSVNFAQTFDEGYMRAKQLAEEDEEVRVQEEVPA